MPTPYHRALARLTRRQALDVALRLGAAAALTPALSRGLWAQPIFHR